MALSPLATPEQVAAYSKGQITETDPRLEVALDGVSAAIRRYCGWHVGPTQAEAFVLDGPGGRLLSLPTLSLRAVSTISENGTELEAGSYTWSAEGLIRKSHGRWTEDYRAISVSATHGYDLWDIADVVSVALAVVTRQLSSPTGATREQAGQVSISWAVTAPGVSGGIALLDHERAVLDHFRVVSA